MRKREITVLAAVLSVAAVLFGCSGTPVESLVEQPPLQAGGLSTYGNCLSTPVVFAEGHGLTGEDVIHNTGLRGTPGIESFIEPYDGTIIEGYPVYRNPSVNEWCADWVDGSSWSSVPVTLDWADNMTRQTWTDRSKVRVEIVLFADIDPGVTPLTGYNMYSLGGIKKEEVAATNTTTYTADLATVYTNVARLTIERLNGEGGIPVLTVYDSPCYDKYFVDGPTDAYSAEINMMGKCIYGFNWDVAEVDLPERSGWYRLTFHLDEQATYTDYDGAAHTYPRNTYIAALDPADLFGGDPEVVVYQPSLSGDGFSSTLDIFISAGKGSKKNITDR